MRPLLVFAPELLSMCCIVAVSGACHHDDRLPVQLVDDAGSNDASVSRRTLRFVPGAIRQDFGGGQPGLGSSVMYPVCTDVDGDGKYDLLFGYLQQHGFGGDAAAPDVSLEWRSEDGGAKAARLECGSDAIYSIVVGNFDRGATVDLVVQGCLQGPQVYLGMGDGRFTPGPHFAPGDSIEAAGDLDGDGLDDLVVGGAQPAVRLASGDGTFRAGPALASSNPSRAILARLDSDLHLDLILDDPAKGSDVVLLGDGDGTFRIRQQLPLGLGVDVARDFNRDGHVDLLATDRRSARWFLPGDGDGRFGDPLPTSQSAPQVADFDLDGKLDVALGSPFKPVRFSVALGRGDGTFETEQGFDVGILTSDVNTFTVQGVCDLDGDGRPDLFGTVSYFEGAALVSFLNRSE